MPRVGTRTGAKAMVRVTGKFVLSTGLTSSALVYPLYPATFPRLGNIAKAFEFFRFVRLRFRLLPGSASSASVENAMFAAGWLPEEAQGSIGVADVWELEPSCTLSVPGTAGSGQAFGVQTVPTNWATVSKARLFGNTPMRWYKTASASSEDAFVEQGQLLLASNAGSDTGHPYLEVEYTAEFAGATSAAQALRGRSASAVPSYTCLESGAEDGKWVECDQTSQSGRAGDRPLVAEMACRTPQAGALVTAVRAAARPPGQRPRAPGE